MDPAAAAAAAAAFEALVTHLKHARLILDYSYVATTAVMAYDHLITLDKEIDLLFNSPFNYTKVLFLFIRYMPVAECGMVIWDQMWPDVSPIICNRTYAGAAWLILFSMNIAEVVLAIRTWAIWRQNRIVAWVLGILILIGVITQCISMVKFTHSLVYSPIPYEGFRGCFITSANTLLIWDYVILMVIEGTLLSLMAISAYRAYKIGDKNQLMGVIHRDGIMFYVYILCFSFVNIMVIRFGPADLLGLFSPLQAVLYSTLTCRIIFNIRETAQKGPLQTMDLHTQYQEKMAFAPEPQSFMMSNTTGTTSSTII